MISFSRFQFLVKVGTSFKCVKLRSKLGLPTREREREREREIVRLQEKKKEKKIAASMCSDIPFSQRSMRITYKASVVY